MKLLLIGKPGSGKGTVAQYLIKKGYHHISTGNIMRQEIENQTDLGIQMKESMARGEFFSDEIALNLAKKGIEAAGGDNYVLDGFPRNLDQAHIFDQQETLDQVIYLSLEDEVILHRLEGREVCTTCGASYHKTYNKTEKEGICDHCGGNVEKRNDDEVETIKRRIKDFNEKTFPLVAHYKEKGILKEIDANCTPEELYKKI